MSAVEQFILERQLDVARRALLALREAEPARLRAEAHRLLGVLGSYRLTDSAAALSKLNDLLQQDAPAPAIASARAAAVSAVERQLCELGQRG